ncbi:hypothetical protein HNP46_006509 [Pseudomonas nitritireducens]|uniref:Uncharacterized protein n=1 Tax=Pseudomonas nitroreducens TaxID=46680 RepID=A0A7W7KRE5_PSENT|nr:hypothetical protein [Pseudomonas nitritireducens]MBB4867595.1 hypothetical protein [Pseudomonas nitritireducens]
MTERKGPGMEPVVSKDDEVVLAICDHCRGYGLYLVTKWADAEALAELSELLTKDYTEKRLTLRSASAARECECRDEQGNPPPPKEARIPTRPVLSIKRNKPAD